MSISRGAHHRSSERGPIVIIGAGVMGTGVAQVFAESGYCVTLIDVSDIALLQAENNIRYNLHLYKIYGKRSAESPAAILRRIAYATDYRCLHECQIVIENVTESWEVKRQLHQTIRLLYPPDALVAINSSVISVSKISSEVRNAAATVGMHFMNPVQLTTAVEVIRTRQTSEVTIKRAIELVKEIGKDAILVNDAAGFVSNRVLMLMINEAIWTVYDAVAEPADVDRIFKQCCGHKMGPLETADLIGLDTVLRSVLELYDAYKDSKYRPCPLLEQMVDVGRFGQKNGHGFYEYTLPEVGDGRHKAESS